MDGQSSSKGQKVAWRPQDLTGIILDDTNNIKGFRNFRESLLEGAQDRSHGQQFSS
jgi:hypothetical protein